MEPKLIFKDVKRAEQLIAVFKLLYPKVKHVYDQVIALDEAFKLDVDGLKKIIVDRVHYNDLSSALTDFVETSIIEKVGEPDFNGVKIAKDKLRSLLSFPSYGHILTYISTDLGNFDRDSLDRIFGFLLVSDGGLVLKDGFEELVHTSFERYTKTDKGALMMEKLEVLIPAINEYNQIFSSNGGTPQNYAFGRDEVNLVGVKFNGLSYVVDHDAVFRYDN